ncbi:unnamed protein product [Parnassius mnemosyne]|uniref:MADF domain-containing protein n=1 Tax=Parnassius mnemosyne TaxID=213953 RepID=A0AAV1LJ71_9NEOP
MDEDEKIIYLVHKYECLFNVKAKTYSDKNCRKNAWQKVSGLRAASRADARPLREGARRRTKHDASRRFDSAPV